MQPALRRVLGSNGDKGRASEAANSGGSTKSDLPQTSYPKDGGDSTVVHNSKSQRPKSGRQRKITVRRRAAHRLAELYRLSALYHSLGTPMDPAVWGFVLAATLGAGKSAWMPTRCGHSDIRWPGLTLESLRTAVDRCGLGGFTDDELVTLINKVEQWQAKHGVRLIGMKRLGDMLNLSAAEREVCRIRTIDAVDETRAERMERLAEARKVRERKAKKAKRACMPRAEYEAQSLAARKPWIKAGISRATWYRRLKDGRETGVSAHQVSIPYNTSGQTCLRDLTS